MVLTATEQTKELVYTATTALVSIASPCLTVLTLEPTMLYLRIKKRPNTEPRAPQELSRRSLRSCFNFRSSVLDLEAYDILS